MSTGITVYAKDGVTEVFNGNSRTMKIVKMIPFDRSLRFTTTDHVDPLFAQETGVWFMSNGGSQGSDLVDVTFIGDIARVKVTTYYKINSQGRYETTSPNPWPPAGLRYIILGVF